VPGAEGGDAGAGGAGGEGAQGTEGQPTGEPEAGLVADEGGAEGGDQPLELTIPEGLEVTDAWRSEVEALAKNAALTPQQRAQAVIDAGVKFRQEIVDQMASDTTERIAQWAEEAKADKVIGGSNFDANLMVAQGAFVKYGDPELKQFLIDSGLGNHPAMLRWAYRVGAAGQENTQVHGLGQEAPAIPANSEAARAQRFQAAASKPIRPLAKDA